MNDPYLVFEVDPSGFVPKRFHAVLAFLAVIFLSHVSLFSTNSVMAPAPYAAPYRVALTFDDGPHPAFTYRLLKILKQERVPATFFVVGTQVERYPHLLAAISRGGHQIANHTYHHYNMTTLSVDKIKDELDATQRLIERVTGPQSPRFFRPPGGQINTASLKPIFDDGYQMVLWSVFPKDHMAPPPAVIYERVMTECKDGGVVLMHSGVEETLSVLPQIIRDLRQKGYRFVTVSEMLKENTPAGAVSAWYAPDVNSPLFKTLLAKRSDAGSVS